MNAVVILSTTTLLTVFRSASLLQVVPHDGVPPDVCHRRNGFGHDPCLAVSVQAVPEQLYLRRRAALVCKHRDHALQ